MSTRTIIRRGTGWVLYRTAGGVIEFQWGTKDEKPDHPIRTDLRYNQTVPIVTVTIPPEAIKALRNEENARLRKLLAKLVEVCDPGLMDKQSVLKRLMAARSAAKEAL